MKKQPSTQRSPLPLLFMGLGVVLLVGVLIWQVLDNAPEATPVAQPAVQPTQVLTADIPFPNIPRVTIADARSAYDQQTAIFLDVRDAASYETGHIPGAINIPLGELENRSAELDKNQWIITYCT